MFSRLGLDALIGRHDEENSSDTAHTREHVFDETLVAGDVNEAYLLTADGRKMRKS